jgi:triacylglycerol lipase
MVRSVTTLATPHDGTTLAFMLADEAGYLLSWLLSLASYLHEFDERGFSYDFKLDQWDLGQHPEESDDAYRDRLLRSDVWEQEDISIHDLGPEGARSLNAAHPAVESVHYFSWATWDSTPAGPGKTHLPASGMNLILAPPSVAIGRFLESNPGAGLHLFDQTWWPNDGVVNTISMSGPKLGSSDHIVHTGKTPANGPLEAGVWHFMGVLTGWDHLDIVGQQTRLDYRAFYLGLAELLASLPRELQ